MDRFRHKKAARPEELGAAACFCFCLFASAAAHASELAGATLETENLTGAESCPNADDLKSRTLALGMPPAEPRAPLAIHVVFQRAGDDFSVIVRTSGRSLGEREVAAAGPSCEPVAAATAVILAVLLDLRPHESRTAVATSPAVPARTAESEPAFRHVALGARLDGAFGLLGRSASMAYAGDARVRVLFLELALGGFGLVDRHVELAPGAVNVGLAGGDLAGCAYLPRFGRSELAGCASFLLGRFHGAGEGFYIDRRGASLWIAGGLGATLAFELSRHWALRFELNALVPFRQYRPEVERVGIAYRASPLAGSAGFGPELRFP